MLPARVLIVDTASIIADGLSVLLDQKSRFSVLSCSGYPEALDCIESFRPQIIVINFHHEVAVDGIEICRQITALPGEYMLLVLAPGSLLVEEALMLEAIEAGADGVLTREEVTLPDLIAALEDLHAGRSLLDARQLREALGARRDADTLTDPPGAEYDRLTPREREVADLIAEGLSTSELAQRLTISERTVQCHINNILTKLGVHSRIEAVVQLYRWRLEQQSPATG